MAVITWKQKPKKLDNLLSNEHKPLLRPQAFSTVHGSDSSHFIYLIFLDTVVKTIHSLIGGGLKSRQGNMFKVTAMVFEGWDRPLAGLTQFSALSVNLLIGILACQCFDTITWLFVA